jgi:hypothetical protein
MIDYMDQIQGKFALPFKPDAISRVNIPAGNTIRVGTAGENFGHGGGGIQVEIRTSNPPATAGN